MSMLEMSTVEQDIAEVDRMTMLIAKLVELGESIVDNREMLEDITQVMRNEKAKNYFMTMDEVGLALRCNADRAKEYLLSRKVPLIKAGKGYVVNKVVFEKHFENDFIN